ncbi:hypothetical protein [uncultured Methanoregula sp.]|uniref:hypothetical protein n=1 Tax=uncultured Methanoregula sp. TaxID=1005933 RepID=UPI002AAAEF34|nr:hypothetical protein [uncultured Methanoregula sp.]
MADFVQNGNIKSAVRILAEPIADAATFNMIILSVITTNPFACVAYTLLLDSQYPLHPLKMSNFF